MRDTADPLMIDFVGDVVCPWCFLGWRRLHAALASRPGLSAQIVWRPFQLDFGIPPEGLPYAAFMDRLFPDRARRREMDARLTKLGEADGVAFRFDLIARRPNTNAAHRLIRWALEAGHGGAAAEAVMTAHFEQARDIGDFEVLAEIGGEVGLEPDEVLRRLASGQDRDLIDNECRAASQAGISGVPFMIFGQRVALSGAESPDRILTAVDKALSLAGPPA